MFSYYHAKPDFVALRKAANANLANIASGEIRRRREAEILRNKNARLAAIEERKQRREEMKSLRKEIVDLRKELQGITPYWEELMDKHNKGTITPSEWGALEEIDQSRDDIYEEIETNDRRLGILERKDY